MTWNNASVACNIKIHNQIKLIFKDFDLDTETSNIIVKVWKDFEKMNALIRLMCIWRAKVVWKILSAWEAS